MIEIDKVSLRNFLKELSCSEKYFFEILRIEFGEYCYMSTIYGTFYLFIKFYKLEELTDLIQKYLKLKAFL